jgi:hypothetical protein
VCLRRVAVRTGRPAWCRVRVGRTCVEVAAGTGVYRRVHLKRTPSVAAANLEGQRRSVRNGHMVEATAEPGFYGHVRPRRTPAAGRGQSGTRQTSVRNGHVLEAAARPGVPRYVRPKRTPSVAAVTLGVRRPVRPKRTRVGAAVVLGWKVRARTGTYGLIPRRRCSTRPPRSQGRLWRCPAENDTRRRAQAAYRFFISWVLWE